MHDPPTVTYFNLCSVITKCYSVIFLITFRRELRLTIEQKEREIHEKDQLLQNLQLRLVGVSVMFHV